MFLVPFMLLEKCIYVVLMVAYVSSSEKWIHVAHSPGPPLKDVSIQKCLAFTQKAPIFQTKNFLTPALTNQFSTQRKIYNYQKKTIMNNKLLILAQKSKAFCVRRVLNMALLFFILAN